MNVYKIQMYNSTVYIQGGMIMVIIKIYTFLNTV